MQYGKIEIISQLIRFMPNFSFPKKIIEKSYFFSTFFDAGVFSFEKQKTGHMTLLKTMKHMFTS